MIPRTRAPISALCTAPVTRLLHKLSREEHLAIDEVLTPLAALLMRAGLAHRKGDRLIAAPAHRRSHLIRDLVDAWLPDVLESDDTHAPSRSTRPRR